ncbi:MULTISPECIES: hypothetical protein [unclassified Kitasatospora]|uniref:hypothetical protein n=1 Tax=unclassified Kitasatospora TaxID=2633591 RepID=UPI00247622B6|nr:hypothetical protein [Kitasatospora sp. MAA19]MDH6710712.1 hypothetical protein [Kitasatospora sp. MAA19]
MRRAATVCTEARIRLRRLEPWSARRVLLVLSAGLFWWLLVVRGQFADGAVLGLLVAGGWGLGLIPVHADRNATGPQRRPHPEAVVPVEAQPPVG